MAITNLGAIKKYFGMDGSTALKECKALSAEERKEIGALCAKELGETIEEKA